MKKRFVLLLIITLALLSACKGLNISTAPTVPPQQVGADGDMATKVAKILTVAATQAVKPTADTPAPTLPPAKGLAVDAPTDQPTLPPTATLEPSPTATLAPTQAPSPTPSPAPTQTPFVVTATFNPTAVVNITPIAASTEDPHNRLGPPTAGDSMDSPTSWVWPDGFDQYTSSQWVNGSLRLTALTTTAGWRLPVVGPFGDVYIEMTARSETCSGKDNYGIFFHVPDKTALSGYWFVVSCDGFYRLAKWDGTTQPKGTYDALINWTASKKIRQGAGQPNRLGILVRGASMSLYVNGYYLATYSDATFPGGFFGVFINGKTTPGYTINVDEMAFWNNPQ